MSEKPSVEELMEEIQESPELTLFFKRIFDDQRYGSLFMLHRDQLLVGAPGPAPYLFWNNLTLERAKRGLQILETIAQLESIRKEQASKTFETILGSGMSEMYDILAFFAVKYAQQNEPIKRLVNSSDLQFPDLKKALAESKPFNSDNVSIDDPILKEKAQKMAAYFQQTFTNSSSVIIPTLEDVFPDPFMRFHLQGYSNELTIGVSSRLESQDYSTLIDDLHSQQAIFSLNTLFWCEFCTDIHQAYRTRSDIAPGHLNMACLRCGKPMLISAIYEMDETIFDSITSKDGILSIAVAWLLRRNEINFQANSYGKTEFDFLLDVPPRRLLIECKMHRTDLNDRAFRGALEQDLTQVSKQLTQLREKAPNIEACLVYNHGFDHFPHIKTELLGKYPGVRFLDYRRLPELVQATKTQ